MTSDPQAVFRPSASYSITMRVELGDDTRGIGHVTTAIGDAGGLVAAVDIVESAQDQMTVDITVNTADGDHADSVTSAVDAVPHARVHKVSDRTFLMHIGGKIQLRSNTPLRNRDDLSMAYTPGVARVASAIANNPADARRLTIKRNTVAVVTDGSAVLGLGNVGPEAALPVMEGKAVLFKQFANVDAWPVCLDTQDTDEVVRTVELLAPVYGGINLEDIAAPRCFEIEERLRESLDIPVFHDDQHGTAIVVLAGLMNALKLVGKDLKTARIVLCGAGAAGVAILKLLIAQGASSLIASDRDGILHHSDETLNTSQAWVAAHTNPDGLTGTLQDALVDADVFIGVSAPNILEPEDLAQMNDGAVVFAMANPTPEVDPWRARDYADVVATGRSDHPNQINNVLAFPGLFRGLLDASATNIDTDMIVAAAEALASVVTEEELRPSYIVPNVFNPDIVPRVAEAVRQAASKETSAES